MACWIASGSIARGLSGSSRTCLDRWCRSSVAAICRSWSGGTVNEPTSGDRATLIFSGGARKVWSESSLGPLGGPWPIIEVDTSREIAAGSIAKAIGEAVRRGGTG
jgi:hypothetical protein